MWLSRFKGSGVVSYGTGSREGGRALNMSTWLVFCDHVCLITGQWPVKGALGSPITRPEGLVSIAARIPDAKVVGHQQHEVGSWGYMAPGLTKDQQQKAEDPHLPAKGKGKGDVRDAGGRWPKFLLWGTRPHLLPQDPPTLDHVGSKVSVPYWAELYLPSTHLFQKQTFLSLWVAVTSPTHPKTK